jgi:hypothetical protein
MEENHNQSLKLEDLDCILSMSKASKSALKECDEAIPKMERFINQYYCIQSLDLGQAEKDLSKIRAIKEQFAANIGLASVAIGIYSLIISVIIVFFSEVSKLYDGSHSPTIMRIIFTVIMFIILTLNIIFLYKGYRNATKEKELVFKCTYMEQHLANYIKKLKEQPEKIQTEDTKDTINADQSSQRKETKK